MSKRRVVWLFGALFALLALACGQDTNGEAGGEAGEAASIEIASPEDGAEVSVPFTVELSSAEEIGAPETGNFHFHVHFDGNEQDYAVVESTSHEITDLSPGEHTIEASLRNADHSAAGAEDEITVTVAGGTGTGEGGESNDTGYDY